MTDPRDHDFTQDPPRPAPEPPREPTDQESTSPRGQHEQPSAPMYFDPDALSEDDDRGPSVTRPHDVWPATPDFGSPDADPEERTGAVAPQRREGTGLTSEFAAEQGGRPVPPPVPPQRWPGSTPMPPPPPGPPQYGPPQRPPAQPDHRTPAQYQTTRIPPAQRDPAGPDGHREGPPPGGRPGPSGPRQGQSWGAPPGQQPSQGGWGQVGYGGGVTPGNYTYVDAIRSSDLVPTRKLPPRKGWRKAVLTMSFGTINLGRSPDERYQDDLEVKARTLLRGRYKIGVLGKGGSGKTTLAAGLGSIFAELRQDDRVVAIDADTAFGKLGSRIDPHAAGSYWELAADQHLNTFADVRSRVGSNAAGLFVLAGEHNTARRRVLDPAIYREAAARLDNHFTISIVDCGSTMDSPVTKEALSDLDALLVVSSPWVDGASAAGQTMDWLGANGYTGLLHRTVVVLNDSDGHADKRMRKVLAEQFSGHGQLVVEVPFDGNLRPGGVIDVDNQINPVTRRRLLEIAAAIAEHFAATTDGHRERR